MTRYSTLELSLLVWLLSTIALIGCSDNSTTSQTLYIAADASPVIYVPLEQGFRVDYTVLEPDISHYFIEVGQPANIAGNSGYQIKRVDRSTGETRLFYRYKKNSSIYESYDISNPGYIILRSPFVVGNSWYMFDTTETAVTTFDEAKDDGTGSTTDIGILGGKPGFDLLGGGFFKNKPGLDYNTMRIVGFEDVQTLNGRQYANCLKVAWQTDPLHTSYFWYYQGVGLVKYEHGFNTVYDQQNHIVGVMTDYKTVEY